MRENHCAPSLPYYNPTLPELAMVVNVVPPGPTSTFCTLTGTAGGFRRVGGAGARLLSPIPPDPTTSPPSRLCPITWICRAAEGYEAGSLAELRVLEIDGERGGVGDAGGIRRAGGAGATFPVLESTPDRTPGRGGGASATATSVKLLVLPVSSLSLIRNLLMFRITGSALALRYTGSICAWSKSMVDALADKLFPCTSREPFRAGTSSEPLRHGRSIGPRARHHSAPRHRSTRRRVVEFTSRMSAWEMRDKRVCRSSGRL